ncbi:MAG: alpha/beta hydrolase [Anaerolineales bacterium]
MYPESIYRSVMIAVDTPSATIYESEVFDELIRHYADLCAHDSECKSRTNDLAETMRTVSHNMPERWLFFPIDPGLVKVGTYNFFESTTEAPMIIDAWLAAAEGDPSGMALLTLVGPTKFTNASVWGHNAALRASLGQFNPVRNYRTELNPRDSIMGSPASTVAFAGYGAWPTNYIPEEYRQVQPSDVETLMVSGSIDFWTPAQLAEDVLLPSLSNGQHIVVAEAGHGEMMWQQPEATRHLLNTFYDTGVGDDSLFTYQPWKFKVGFGFPLMAKTIVAVILLVIALLALLVRFMVRRRKASQVSS